MWGARPFYLSVAKRSKIILRFISLVQAEISCLLLHSRLKLHEHLCEMAQLTNVKTNGKGGACKFRSSSRKTAPFRRIC